MRKYFLILFILFAGDLLTVQAQTEDKTSFLDIALGNWFEPGTNTWEYGFFEDFIIYGGAFWDYQSIDEQDRKFLLVMDNGKETMRLAIRRAGATLSIQRGEGRALNYRKVTQVLPGYSGFDTARFVDTRFRRIDTTVITGYLRNRVDNKPFEVQLLNWLTGKTDNYSGVVDSFGRFELKIPLVNTSQVYMDWGRSFLVNVLQPGENVFVFHNPEDRETLFHGPGARFQNEIASYYSAINFFDRFRPEQREHIIAKAKFEATLTPENFLAYKKNEWDSLGWVNHSFFDHYGMLSRRAKSYITNSTALQIGYDIALHMADDEGDPPAEYSSFLRDHFVDKPLAPKSLIRENYYLTNAYINSMYPRDNFVSHGELFVDLVRKGIIDAGEDLLSFGEVVSRVKVDLENAVTYMSPPDSLELLRIVEADSTIPQRFNNLVENHRELLNMYSSIVLRLDRPMVYHREHLGREWVDIFRTHTTFGLLTKAETFPSYLLAEIVAPIHNPFFNAQIVAENSRLQDITSSALRYPEHLISADLFSEAEDVDMLMEDILTPHRGKVVYIDFWGT